MPLPERKRYGIKDLAKRWGISEEEVCERIREGQFNYLIISYHGAFGASTRHYYISYKVPENNDRFSSKPSISSKDSRWEWHGYIHSIEEFPWPREGETLYIPRTEVEAFEKEHKIRPDLKPSKLKATGITPQSGSDAMPAPTGRAWIPIARTIGVEIAKKSKYQNQDQIAEKVRKEMVNRHTSGDSSVTGRGGRIPSAGTIKRSALKGIIGTGGDKKPVKPSSWG